jgi:2-dehydro-3-deoxygluconokinase
LGGRARWFHTAGLTALSETTRSSPARRWRGPQHGTVVSYDLNYRPSLWKSIGGQKRAQEVNRQLAPLVDAMLGNEEDFTAALGFAVEGMDEHLSALDPANFARMIEKAVAAFPNFKAVGTTLRNAKTATFNDWGACTRRPAPPGRRPENLEVLTARRRRLVRLRAHHGFRWAGCAGPSSAAAHGALAMTTPGDTTMATLAEVERVMKGGAARVAR